MKDRNGNELVEGDYVEIDRIARGSCIGRVIKEVSLPYGRRISLTLLDKPGVKFYYSSLYLEKRNVEELI